MKAPIHILLFCFILAGMTLSAQTPQDQDSSASKVRIFKERGLNMTPLLVQFVPLGKSSVNSGPIVYQSQSIKNGKLARFGLGGNLDSNAETFHLNVRFGLGKEIVINPKWTYYRGTDLWLFGGNQNTPISSFSFESVAGIGVAPFIGLKYHINSFLNLATESHIFIGVADLNPFVLQVIPPLSLLLNVRLPKERLKRNRISIIP
ncbi:MAG: hypothetical protein AAF587_35755 [Bacteroidota bacterium]